MLKKQKQVFSQVNSTLMIMVNGMSVGSTSQQLPSDSHQTSSTPNLAEIKTTVIMMDNVSNTVSTQRCDHDTPHPQ